MLISKINLISNTESTLQCKRLAKKQFVFFFLLLLSITLTTAQTDDDPLGTEVVTIVKPYAPSISDAFKIKETPVLNNSVAAQKTPVEYSIFSVPVASTFTPAKGKAATVVKAEKVKLYDNYATLGFGNYTTILGELYSNFQLSRTDNVGVFFKHNSAQGDIDGIRADANFFDTQLDLNYTSRQRDVAYNIDAGVSHEQYNWYGINDDFNRQPNTFFTNTDFTQNYFSGYLGGGIAFEDSFFSGVSGNLRYLSDSYESSEINVKLQPEFLFPISDNKFTLGIDVDYVSGSFFEGLFLPGAINYNHLNAGFLPSLDIVNNDLSLSLGVAAYTNFDLENSDTNFYLYPNVSASYRVVDEIVIAYAGAEGGLMQNSFYSFKEVNPYISPTLTIMPTSKTYDIFGGLKGKLANSIAYNLNASYKNETDKALFVANTFSTATDTEGYKYGNSFGILYDDVNTLQVFGEITSEISQNFSLGVNATFNSYSTDTTAEAWNLPALQATLFTTFSITEKLYGGASIFYVGERKDLDLNTAAFPSVSPVVTLDGYVDLNVNFGYKFSDRLSVFVKGSNLIGDNYERWYNYNVQGIQVLGGATYKFDW
jgi:hypothetical protein